MAVDEDTDKDPKLNPTADFFCAVW